MKITVLYNLANEGEPESEKDTENSAKEIAETLGHAGYTVSLCGVSRESISKIIHIDADLVFNLIEWTGADTEYAGRAFKFLEKTGVPFTGSDRRGYLLGCNKVLMKKIMKANKIPTPEFVIFKTGKEKIPARIKFPLIVKLANEHCSLGISQMNVVNNEEELRGVSAALISRHKQPVLVEEFIAGAELHITLLENNGRPVALPAAEIKFFDRPGMKSVLTYDCKWREDSLDSKNAEVTVPSIDTQVLKKAVHAAKQCYRVLGGRDYPRVDLRIRDGEVFVLEINNNPGIDFTLDSGIGFSAHRAGLSYEQLLTNIVEGAVERWKGVYETVTIN